MPHDNHYLSILELKTGATKSEVKAAYRRLSKIYHPDVNPSPEAEAKFIEIHEAYDFLTRVGPRPQQQTVAYDYDPVQKQYDAHRQQAKAYARKRAKEAQKQQQLLIKKILKGFRRCSLAYILFNILLAVDFLIPTSQHQEKIIQFEAWYDSYQRDPENMRVLINFEHYTIAAPMRYAQRLNHTVNATVYATPIFNKPISADIVYKSRGELEEVSITPGFSGRTIYRYIIPLVALIYLWYFAVARLTDHKLTLAILMVFLFVIQSFSFLLF